MGFSELGGGGDLDLWDVQILKSPIPSSLRIDIPPVPIRPFVFVITLFCTIFSKCKISPNILESFIYLALGYYFLKLQKPF